MDLDKLEELIQEYLQGMDDGDDIEIIATEKRHAQVPLEEFLEWLRTDMYYVLTTL